MKLAPRRHFRATPTSTTMSPPGASEPRQDGPDGAQEQTAVRPLARRDSGVRGAAIGRDASGSPSAFALTVRLNGVTRQVPVVADSLERLVPLAEALELASDGFDGGIVRAPWPVLRVNLSGLSDARSARQQVEAHKAELLGELMDALPRDRRLLQPGLTLDVLGADAGMLIVGIKLDAPDAATAVLAELAPAARAALAQRVGGQAVAEPCELALERVRVGCTLDPEQLADAALRASPMRLAASVQRGLRYLDFALSSPRTAAVQNQAVFCAISRVALALGHDPRPVLSEGHAHAARFGGCTSVVTFAARGDRLRAELELPLPLEPHGQKRVVTLDVSPSQTSAEDADEARLLAACVGLASQLPALRAAIVN